MNKPFLVKLMIVTLVVCLLGSHAAALIPSVRVLNVQAAAPKFNVITGLFRSISALNKRNRVYAEARATAEEVNAYYDVQIATAQRLRQEKIAAAASGGKKDPFIRSYIRATAALEQERRAMIQMMELFLFRPDRFIVDPSFFLVRPGLLTGRKVINPFGGGPLQPCQTRT